MLILFSRCMLCFKQKTAYEMRISDWSSDVCSSDLLARTGATIMSIEADCGMNRAFADFTIDRADERLLGPNGPVKLGNKAYRVLLMLAEHEGRLLTKDALFSSRHGRASCRERVCQYD